MGREQAIWTMVRETRVLLEVIINDQIGPGNASCPETVDKSGSITELSFCGKTCGDYKA